MAVLGFGPRDTVASGEGIIKHCCFCFFCCFLLFFSAGFKRTAGGGVPVVVREVVNLTGTCIRDLLPDIGVEVV